MMAIVLEICTSFFSPDPSPVSRATQGLITRSQSEAGTGRGNEVLPAGRLDPQSGQLLIKVFRTIQSFGVDERPEVNFFLLLFHVTSL